MSLFRFPSKKTCVEAFGPEKGAAVRKAYETAANNGKLNGFRPRTRELMEEFDSILGTHGVEGIPPGHNSKSPSIDYCNTGDTYGTTIMLLNNDTWRIGSWGDIVERGNYD